MVILTQVTYHDSSFEKYIYNTRGLVISAENIHSKTSFERDILGDIIKETTDEHFISYENNISGSPKLITSSLGANIYNEFDEFGHLTKINSVEWQGNFKFNELGLETDINLPGNINYQTQRDKIGRPTTQNIKNNTVVLHQRQYAWDVNYRLQALTDSQTGTTRFYYNNAEYLTKTIFSDGEEQIRNPDAVGNLFSTTNFTDKHFEKGSRLLKKNGGNYKYDDEGNLIEKKEANGATWKYKWYACNMLACVIRPDNDEVKFTYDAFGRRLSKQYKNTVTKWLWDGNKPLHEWKEHIKTKAILNDTGVEKDGIITWLYKENSFTPVSKIKGKKSYSIISDHLSTPYSMYTASGEKFWEAVLDTYGNLRMQKGEIGSCPFRYQGQYEDAETGLYYNRFRYYSANDGQYINQDPIKLYSGQPNLYAYVKDTNIYIDLFGLVGGGSYREVRDSNDGGEVHHMPANSVNRDTGSAGRDTGPAIHMSTDDHAQTASHGRQGLDAADYRQKQADHINNGRYDNAMAMDIRDVSGLFPGRYKKSMLQAVQYAVDRDPPLITEQQAKRLRKLCK